MIIINYSIFVILSISIAVNSLATGDSLKYSQEKQLRFNRPKVEAKQESIFASKFNEKLYELCENPDKHILKPISVKLNPPVPQVGRDIDIMIELEATENIGSLLNINSLHQSLDENDNGGVVFVELWLGFIKITRKYGLCQLLDELSGSNDDVRCPLKKGIYSIKLNYSIPAQIPAVRIHGNVKAFKTVPSARGNPLGPLMTCINVDFKLQS